MLAKMMANVTCTTCGAALVAGAKFCRQCGQLVVNPGVANVTEATTRTLHTPVEFAAPQTQYIPAQPTGPAYMAPSAQTAMPAGVTNNLEPRKQPKAWMMVLLVVLLVVAIGGALFALGVIKLNINSSRTGTNPPTAPVEQPPAGEIPEPPPPPEPPMGQTPPSTSVRREFIYPGAETLVDMVQADGGGLLQLRTKDAYQKVVDWYVATLKPEQIIKSPGTQAVLKSKRLMAVINSTGEGTNITLKLLGESDGEMDGETEIQ